MVFVAVTNFGLHPDVVGMLSALDEIDLNWRDLIGFMVRERKREKIEKNS